MRACVCVHIYMWADIFSPLSHKWISGCDGQGQQGLQRQEEPSCMLKPAAAGGAGEGVNVAQHLLGTWVGGCSKSCADSSLHSTFLAGHRELEKHFSVQSRSWWTYFLLTIPLQQWQKRQIEAQARARRQQKQRAFLQWNERTGKPTAGIILKGLWGWQDVEGRWYYQAWLMWVRQE